MILIINLCAEKLHYYEFVKPIEEILKINSVEYLTKHYNDIDASDLLKFSKIIICGTSLKDNEFIKDLNKFNLLININKPVLGICGGSHVIGLILRYKLEIKNEIGLKEININEEFLGAKGKLQVYHLHGFQVLPEIYHKDNFYATVFHPEVRNKALIVNFCNLKSNNL